MYFFYSMTQIAFYRINCYVKGWLVISTSLFFPSFNITVEAYIYIPWPHVEQNVNRFKFRSIKDTTWNHLKQNTWVDSSIESDTTSGPKNTICPELFNTLSHRLILLMDLCGQEGDITDVAVPHKHQHIAFWFKHCHAHSIWNGSRRPKRLQDTAPTKMADFLQQWSCHFHNNHHRIKRRVKGCSLV